MPAKKFGIIKFYIYSEVNKYLITLWFCKFSYLEIMEGSTIFSIGAFPLWETESKNKNPEITLYDFLTIYLWITVSNNYLITWVKFF